MSISLFIDEKNNLMIRKVVGRITLDDIMASNANTARQPNFKINMNVIWDLTQAEVGHFSTRDLKTLSHWIRDHAQLEWRGDRYKLAIAAPKELNYIVSSTFCIIGEIENLPITLRAFRNYQKAFNWILAK